MSKYYTILERNAGESWAIAWGDYDRETVKEEMADLKSGYNRAQHYMIMITGDTQAEIEAGRDHENKIIADKTLAEFAEVKTQERCLKTAVKAFDLDRYANGCEMVRCEIEADLVAIVYPDLSRIAENYNSAQYEYAATFCDQKMDLVAELFADRITEEMAGV